MRIRGTSTNQLSDVIQTLSVARKTGMLVVERESPTGSSELGTITFNNGQVTDANIGPLRGADAFKKISTWTTCHFLFQPPSAMATSPPSSPWQPEFGTSGTSVVLPEQTGPYPSVPRGVVPYRGQQFQGNMPDFQRHGLSRTHRQLFLLIDGNRSPEALARLIGRNLQEVRVMLADLERAGLIHQ
jgi:Domain of unknown function (DUF4388)